MGYTRLIGLLILLSTSVTRADDCVAAKILLKLYLEKLDSTVSQGRLPSEAERINRDNLWTQFEVQNAQFQCNMLDDNGVVKPEYRRK